MKTGSRVIYRGEEYTLCRIGDYDNATIKRPRERHKIVLVKNLFRPNGTRLAYRRKKRKQSTQIDKANKMWAIRWAELKTQGFID